jgi:hypothetical protein
VQQVGGIVRDNTMIRQIQPIFSIDGYAPHWTIIKQFHSHNSPQHPTLAWLMKLDEHYSKNRRTYQRFDDGSWGLKSVAKQAAE